MTAEPVHQTPGRVLVGFFLVGILLFSGSLYLLVLTDIRWIGPITPLGGMSFMVGWALLITSGLRRNK